jgi:branched-chain amino acid transport system permease protein
LRSGFRSWTGIDNKVLANVLAFVIAMAVMIVVAWLIERLVLRKLVNQEGITLLMATLGITYFLDGLGQTLFGSDIYKIDMGMPKDPIFLEKVFQGGILVNKEDLVAAGIAAALVARWPRSSSTPAPAGRCARWPTTTRRRSPSAFRSTASG